MRALIGLLCVVLAGCSASEVSRTSFVFGTMVQITVGPQDAERAVPAVDAVLRDLDALHQELHPWQPGPLRTVNDQFARGKPARLTPAIAELLTLSQQYWRLSDGLFNAAVGGLIAEWGFHSDVASARLPDAGRVAAWVEAAPTPLDVTRQGLEANAAKPQVQLDFGGIAKGWALDRAARQLRAAGIHNALINIGGNILVLGKNGERPWHVALRDPRQPQDVMLELDLLDGEAVGTSGDYQRFFTVGNTRYSHLLDPRTGQPARELASVTVITGPAPAAGLVSDVAGKPLFIGGIRQLPHYANRFGIRNWLAVAPDRTVYLSKSMQLRADFHKPVPKLVLQEP